jgi:hypothetical protein
MRQYPAPPDIPAVQQLLCRNLQSIWIAGWIVVSRLHNMMLELCDAVAQAAVMGAVPDVDS